jgi:hypothetical protein
MPTSNLYLYCHMFTFTGLKLNLQAGITPSFLQLPLNEKHWINF